MAAGLVQDPALERAIVESLVRLLPADVDELPAGLAQRLHRHALAVDVATRSTVRADNAPYDALARFVEIVFGKPPGNRRCVFHVEFGAHFSPSRTRSDRARVRAGAECECQGVDEDRFAGPGFTGQNGHACAECHVYLVDDGEIPDFERSQHEDARISRQLARTGHARDGPS